MADELALELLGLASLLILSMVPSLNEAAAQAYWIGIDSCSRMVLDETKDSTGGCFKG